MANIQLVIELDEDITKGIIDGGNDAPRIIVRDCQETIADAIKNGTPLPKGHGDLVDISPYKGKVICSHLYNGVKKLIEVDSIEPIIEADKPKNGCSACPRSGSIIDGYKDCLDAYTKQSQYCGFNNKE